MTIKFKHTDIRTDMWKGAGGTKCVRWESRSLGIFVCMPKIDEPNRKSITDEPVLGFHSRKQNGRLTPFAPPYAT